MLHVLSETQFTRVPAPRSSSSPAGLRHDPAARAVLTTVAAARGFDIGALCGIGRCAEVSMARQIAMYLMHVELGRKYAEVGRMFGRDRTTVSHACAVIEDLREDAGFDAEVEAMEAAIRAQRMELADAGH